MDKLVIKGGKPLSGTIEISGAKNSVLALMMTSILTDEDLTLHNVPYLSDVLTLAELLENFGITIKVKNNGQPEDLYTTKENNLSLTLNGSTINNLNAPYSIAKKMRASFWSLGPMLAKFGKATVSLPGGCSIGTRQIDLHLDTLKAMGAEISISNGYANAKVNGRLKATNFTFNKVSVGATINAIMSAVLAEGVSTFLNCAQEPEIQDMCHLLVKMGADIKNIGTSKLIITGQDKLQGATHTTMSDRIETGTYIAAIGLTGGSITLNNVDFESIKNLIDTFKKTGIQIEKTGDRTMQISSDKQIKAMDIQTMPYPGFPTDMQAQFTALMCLAPGTSCITENLFENRFMHIPELQRMGADITINNRTATVVGVPQFNGAKVMATDLRASVCLVLAALSTPEETIIDRIYHIDRGYCRIEHKLAKCGVDIKRVK